MNTKSDQAPARRFQVESLQVDIYPSNAAMGAAAASQAAAILREAVSRNGEARVILASANSQLSFIEALTQKEELPWDKITCFHMDEYVGIDSDHSASFAGWMKARVLETMKPKAFHFLNGKAADPEAEAKRYGALIQEKPIDLTCMGIGENGHIAFNDPPVADFKDPLPIKLVELEERCKQQQVGEGHFPSLQAVPTHAFSLTIPTLLSGKRILCIVPEQRKAEAVRKTLEGPIATSCPSSILRQQAHAVLLLDEDAASELKHA
jgi:glucosamine-6-phosphate deaminase